MKLEDITKLTKEELKAKLWTKERTPKCVMCGAPMEMAYDKILKRKSKYLWKPTCDCISKNMRVVIL